MKRSFTLFAVIALCLASVASSVAARGEIKVEVRSVGIVSLLGDTITLYRFGKWFDGYSYEHELTGADFDGLAEAAIEERLKARNPEIVAQRIPLDKAQVIRDSNRGLLALYNADVRDVRKAIAPWAAAQNVDIVIIVRQLNQAVPIQAPQSNFRGVGLYTSFSVEPPVPVASLGLLVWDGKTLEHIAEGEVFVIGFDNAGYSTDDKMKGNLVGPQRERLVTDLRRLVQRAVPGLLAQVRL